MKSLNSFLILCGMFAITTFGCNKSENLSTASMKDSTLMKSKWVLTAFQDTKTNQITNYPENVPQESISINDSLVMVSGTCNGGRSNYIIKDNDISIYNLEMTRQYCLSYQQWEDYLVNNLNSAFQYKITNSTNLEIYSHGSYHLLFVATSK